MSPPTRKLAAIMFADIVGYTAMMQEDEGKTKIARDRHREVIERAVVAHAGKIVQYYGDGALCIYDSAKEAVECAQEIQQDLQVAPAVPVRIGIHLGDVVCDHEGVFGDGVNVASRIESLGVQGAVLISDKIYHEIENHPSIRTVFLGKFDLKNVKRPVGVYALDHDGIVVPKPGDIVPIVVKTQTRSIAVMPFTHMSNEESQDYFADGVSEEIINGLTKISGLSIISRTTCMAIQNTVDDKIAEGRRLGVSHFLEGSVRRAGDRVRVSVQLVNTVDSYQLWAETYKRDLHDIFEVQDEIARSVINALKINFNLPTEENQVIAKPTDNLEAYTLFLKGMHHWKKQNPEDTKKAVDLFNKALVLDPQFPSTQCALSGCFSYLGSCGVLAPIEAYSKSLNYALTAIENNPKLAEGHLAMANIKFYHFWDWAGAYDSLLKAESLGLNSAMFNQTYGLYYSAVGKLEEGVIKMQKALQLDPLSIQIMNTLATLYIFNGQHDKAISIYNEILELEPTFRGAYLYRGVALMSKGQFERAHEDTTKYYELVNKPKRGSTALIITHHVLGNVEAVERLLKEFHERDVQESDPGALIDLAIAYSGTENYDKAIDYLDRIYEKRLSIACMGMIWVIRCPLFNGLWSEPRFVKLMDKMGIVE